MNPGPTIIPAEAQPVSPRSILIGLALIPPNVIWIVWMERVSGTVFSTTASLFFTAVFSLLILTGLNALLRRLVPRAALRQGELLTAYSLLSVGTAMAGVDFMSPLMTLMAHGFRFATPENNWTRLWPYLPAWLTVRDTQALKGYYEGNASLYTPGALRAWVPPLAYWTVFILGLLATMACLNTLLRAQWVERERLSFPIVQLPVAMTTENGSLWRERLFWLGTLLAGGLNFVNGLHFLNPAVPALTFNGYDAGQLLTLPPWSAFGWTPLALFPFVIGLGYLLPVDLLFSCWFFFFVFRLEKVAATALGFVGERTRFPYVDEQMFGGYIAVCVFALWSARGALKQIWRRALSDDATPDPAEAHEPMTYRTAVWGTIAGFTFLVGFGAAAGLPPWIGALFFGVYFAIAVAVTRMRAELGPPTHDLHFIGPNQTLVSVFGTTNLGNPALGVFTLFYWFNRAYRCHPMPLEMEAFKMAQTSGTKMRGLVPALLSAALVGIVSTAWTTLHVSYHLGAAARIHGWASLGYGGEAYTKFAGWVSTPSPPDWGATGGMLAGFGFAALLSVLRRTVLGWPFHALGFALSGGWSMTWAWLSLFVAWVFKAVILRYGGLRGYRAGLPFFFGVIVGDITIGAIWALIGLLFDIPVYSVWSG